MGILATEGQENKTATAEDAEAAIRRLDGAKFSLVLFTLFTGETLLVGGGPNRFVVELATDSSHRWCVITGQCGDENISLVVGGQSAEFPGDICVSIDVAIEAIRSFINSNGKRSEQLEWAAKT